MLTLLALFLSSPAAACPATAEMVTEAATAAENSFANLDRDGFQTNFAQVTEYIGCLEEVIRPREAAQIHALYGYNAFVSKDRQAAKRAMQVAVALNPQFAPPETIAKPGGPLHALFLEAQTRPEVSRVGFGEPEGTVAFIDGSQSTERPISAPTIIQLRETAVGVRYSAYLTTTDTLPEWMPSAKQQVADTVGEDVIKELMLLRLNQQDSGRLLVEARDDLWRAARTDWESTATKARASDESGKAALEAFVARYRDAAVIVNGVKYVVTIEQLPMARMWLSMHGEFGAEETAVSEAERLGSAAEVLQARAEDDWDAVKTLIHSADYGGRAAVKSFIDTYEDAEVEVGKHSADVFIEQLDEARDWEAIYDLAVAKLPDATDTLGVAIELADDRAKKHRQTNERAARATANLLSAANDDFGLAMAVADKDVELGKTALGRFVDRYERAKVNIDGVSVEVAIPEVSEAKAWLASPPEPVVEPPPEPEEPAEEPAVVVADPPVVTEQPAVGQPAVVGAQPFTGQPQVIMIGQPGMGVPQEIPTKARVVKAAVATGIIGGILHGGSYITRYYYDDEPSDELYLATDGQYIGSLALGGLCAVFTTVAIATPSIAKKRERRAQGVSAP